MVGEPVDTRFGPAYRGRGRFDAGADLARERINLVFFEPDGVQELERRPFPDPDGAGAQAQSGERLDERDLAGFGDVERAAHRRHDRREAEHLVLPRSVFGVEMVDIAPRDRRGQAFGDILETALGHREDLVPARTPLQRQRDQLDGRATVDGEHVDQRFQGHSLSGAKASERS